MNDEFNPPPGPNPLPGSGSTPPMIPTGAPPWIAPGPEPLGTQPAERAPISGVIAAVEAILRQPRRVMFQIKQPRPAALIMALLVITAVCAGIYGFVVGTFSGSEQLWEAPVKILGGMVFTTVICLPSLYIFSCLGGSQARLVEVLGLVTGLLALMTMLMIGFAPVAWVFSQSTKSEAGMGALHLAFWLVATLFGLRFLRAGFKHFSVRSHAGLNVWIVVFLLVAMQMTTALRPIIGRSESFLPAAQDKKFFIGYWFDCLDKGADETKTRADAK